MAEVYIERLTDYYDSCDLCGGSYADGANIWVDGSLVKELVPVAHCFGGDNFTDEDILAAVLEHFGHTLKREQETS